MKSLNPSPENCRRSGVMGTGLIPGHGPAIISTKVSYGQNQYEVSVPSNSSFGYLKSVICQSLGLKPETFKLLLSAIEKEDDENVQIAGLNNNSVVEVMACGQQGPEEASKGEDAVAKVREEVDKLEQQVSALQAVIHSGKKVDDKEIVYLTEMLMRQLLKLDGIEAEGEGKVQRKSEVRRVQIIVETLDVLKSRNSTSSTNEWRAFDPMPSSSSPAFTPSSSSLSPALVPSSSAYPVPYLAQQPTFSYWPYAHPSSNLQGMPYYAPSTHYYPFQYYDPSQIAHYHDPNSYMPPPSSNPFSMPSPKVTENWEHFGG